MNEDPKLLTGVQVGGVRDDSLDTKVAARNGNTHEDGIRNAVKRSFIGA